MADKSKIEWTDATWNPIRGCSRVSEGCRNCYAERVASRFGGPGQPYEGVVNYRSMVSGLTYENRKAAGSATGHWNGKVKLIEEHLNDPLHWKKPRRIFVNSMSDLFHENVSRDTIKLILDVIEKCPQHTFQVLTKRADRMRDEMQHWCAYPYPNLWLGVSVENQATADARIPELLRTPAAVRFISYEPALGPVRFKLNEIFLGDIGWIICGGESGSRARPMHPDWARSARDQCQAAGVKFFFKQWGEYADLTAEPNGSPRMQKSTCDQVFTASGEHLGAGYRSGRKSDGLVDPDWRELGGAWMGKIGKAAAGRELDGRTWDEMPETAAAVSR